MNESSISPLAGTSNEEQLAALAPTSAHNNAPVAHHDKMDFEYAVPSLDYSGAQMYDYPPPASAATAASLSSSIYGDTTSLSPYPSTSSVYYGGYSSSAVNDYNTASYNGFGPATPPVPPHAPPYFADYTFQQQQRQHEWNYDYRQFHNNMSNHSADSFSTLATNYSGGPVNASVASTQRMQMWNAHNAPASSFMPSYYNQHDSGVHSMTHSSATSVISSIHAASQISGISSLPDGSTADGSSSVDASIHLTDAQRARFHNIPLPANFRHASPEQIRRTLPDLIPLLNDTDDEEVVCEALHILYRIVRADDGGNALLGSGACAQAIVDGVFHAMRTFKTNKMINRQAVCTLYCITLIPRCGVELLIKQIDDTNAKCLSELLDAIRIRELSCFKYAIIILHTLMIEPKVARTVTQHVRDVHALAQIVERLSEPNEKFVQIVIDIIRRVVQLDASQRKFFCKLKGPSRLIHILETAQYENLLSRTAKLLTKIANCHPDAVVEAGAFDALRVRLAYGDQKEMRELFACLCYLSDVPTAGRDLSALLGQLLRIFSSREVANGGDDANMHQSCAYVMANLSANNSINKTFLVRNGVIDAAMNALFVTETLLGQTRRLLTSSNQPSIQQEQQKQQYELERNQDSVLMLLGNVSSGHELARYAQCEMMRTRPNGDIFLQKLAKKRPVLMRRTLRILCQTSTNEACLPHFYEISATGATTVINGVMLPLVPYVKEIVECLQLSSQYYDQTAEDINLSDLAQDSMVILTNLCRDDFLLHTIATYVRHTTMSLNPNGPFVSLPQFLLCCDKLCAKALVFCGELAHYPQMALYLSSDLQTMKILTVAATSGTHNHMAAARRCLDCIHEHTACNYFTKAMNSMPLCNDMLMKHDGRSPVPSCSDSSDEWRYQNAQKSHSLQYTSDERKINSYQQNRKPQKHCRASNSRDVALDSNAPLPPDCIMTTSTPSRQGETTKRTELFAKTLVVEEDTVISILDDSSACDTLPDDDDDFGGAAARCSTPVDASSLHATIGSDLNGSNDENKHLADVFDWHSVDMSASSTTIVGNVSNEATAQASATFEQMNLYDGNIGIANAFGALL